MNTDLIDKSQELIVNSSIEKSKQLSQNISGKRQVLGIG